MLRAGAGEPIHYQRDREDIRNAQLRLQFHTHCRRTRCPIPGDLDSLFDPRPGATTRSRADRTEFSTWTSTVMPSRRKNRFFRRCPIWSCYRVILSSDSSSGGRRKPEVAPGELLRRLRVRGRSCTGGNQRGARTVPSLPLRGGKGAPISGSWPGSEDGSRVRIEIVHVHRSATITATSNPIINPDGYADG